MCARTARKGKLNQHFTKHENRTDHIRKQSCEAVIFPPPSAVARVFIVCISGLVKIRPTRGETGVVARSHVCLGK